MKTRNVLKGIITLVMVLLITGLMMSNVFAQRNDANFERGVSNAISTMVTGTLSSEEIAGIRWCNHRSGL